MATFPKKALQKLRPAIVESRKAAEPFCARRYEAIEQYMGMATAGKPVRRTSRNLLEKFVTTYMGLLAGQLPSCRIQTAIQSLKAEAYVKQRALRQRSRDLNLGEVFPDAILDAFFGMGIVRCGLTTKTTVSFQGHDYPVGEPYAKVVSINDYIPDMTARRFDEMQFEANRFYAERDTLEEYGGLSGKVLDRLRRAEESQKKNNPQALGSGQTVFGKEYKPLVELHDVYLPSEKLILTFDLYGSDDEDPIGVHEYDGLDEGPFIKLWFHRIPDNLLPLPPVSSPVHLHRLLNDLSNKTGDQAQRAKKLGLYQKANEKDVKNIQSKGDGELVGLMGNPSAVEERVFGGPDQNVFSYQMYVEDRFNRDCGNLELLSGLSAQSATATQDQLLAASASRLVQKMQERVMIFYRDVYRHIAYYDHHNQLYKPQLVERIEGTDVDTPLPWTTDGEFPDYQFDIVPESFTFDPPSAKLGKLMNFVQNVYPILERQSLQQGTTINALSVFEKYFEYSNMESDFRDVVSFAAPRSETMEELKQSTDHPTKRTYERVSRSAQTQQGSDRVMMQSLMGANPQDKQMAGMMRSA